MYFSFKKIYNKEKKFETPKFFVNKKNNSWVSLEKINKLSAEFCLYSTQKLQYNCKQWELYIVCLRFVLENSKSQKIFVQH